MSSRAILLNVVVWIGLIFQPASSFAENAPLELPIETRKQMFFLKVDAEAANIADRLVGVYVYLYRNGANLSSDQWLSPLEGERQKRLINRGLLFDRGVRSSVAAWIELFSSNMTAIADPLAEVEAKVFLRDAYSVSLLNSPRFSKRLLEISQREGFDFRPIVRKKIRELQFSGDAVTALAMGGVIGWTLKSLGMVKVGVVLSTVSIAAFAGQGIWEYATEKPEDSPNAQSMKAGAEMSSQRIRQEVEASKENQRRLVILEHASEIQKALPNPANTVDIETLKRTQSARLTQLKALRPDLEKYAEKLRRDELPIKAAEEDDAAVREEISRSLEYLFDVLDRTSK